MASPRERRAAPPSGHPAFADRTEAGVLLGAAVLRALEQTGDSERERGPTRHTAATERAADRSTDARSPAGSSRLVAAAPLILALPRGGVPVGCGVARALNAPLDVLMVRKIGHPAAPELGLGAIAEDRAGGVPEPFFDQEMLAATKLAREDLADVVTRERAELARRVAVYRSQPRSARTHGSTAAGEDPAGGESAGPGKAAMSADVTGRLVIVVDDGLATGVTARAALRAVRAGGAARVMLAVPVAAPAAALAMKKETDEVVTLVTPRRFRSVGEWYGDFGQLTDADVLTLLAAIP
jgi:predicted phosphoribosyltransferase